VFFLNLQINVFNIYEVNALRLNPSQTCWYSIYLPLRDGRLSWPWCWLYTETVNLLTDSRPSTYSESNHGLCGSNKQLYKRCAKSMGRPKFRPLTAPTFFNRS